MEITYCPTQKELDGQTLLPRTPGFRLCLPNAETAMLHCQSRDNFLCSQTQRCKLSSTLIDPPARTLGSDEYIPMDCWDSERSVDAMDNRCVPHVTSRWMIALTYECEDQRSAQDLT